jgi:hypothetical protein
VCTSVQSGPDAEAQVSNRLANETSPYLLLQHADNPVHWLPWGDEAFEASRERDVPILLSVGDSACHWCHVMPPDLTARWARTPELAPSAPALSA